MILEVEYTGVTFVSENADEYNILAQMNYCTGGILDVTARSLELVIEEDSGERISEACSHAGGEVSMKIVIK